MIKIKEKSENDFEHKLTYITAGTLILSLTFIEKIVPLKDSKGVLFLITGWGVLVVSLLVNIMNIPVPHCYW